MTSKKTVAGIVKVLLEELRYDTGHAKRIAERLCLVQGNQSYFNTVKAVADALGEIHKDAHKAVAVALANDKKRNR